MGVYAKEWVKGKTVFVGLDLHKENWQLTAIADGEVVFENRIIGCWEQLKKVLDKFEGADSIETAYEAGCHGFWIYDRIMEYGAKCIVTPPSLLPVEAGNHVKTDRRDSRKLAALLSNGMLKQVWVPTPQERHFRQVLRRRRQLVRERVRVQNQILSELLQFGMHFPKPRGRWGRQVKENLCRIKFPDRLVQMSFRSLLTHYEQLDAQVKTQTDLIYELARRPEYAEQVQILTSAPGIGILTAMEILLEIGDMGRFRKAKSLGAYVGLTPSQYSSGEKVRMGRITRVGKASVRAALIEAAWTAIRKDEALREIYERIKTRAGAKRAIVSIARRLLLRLRRMVLDDCSYAFGVVG
jgi:transposase